MLKREFDDSSISPSSSISSSSDFVQILDDKYASSPDTPIKSSKLEISRSDDRLTQDFGKGDIEIKMTRRTDSEIERTLEGEDDDNWTTQRDEIFHDAMMDDDHDGWKQEDRYGSDDEGGLRRRMIPKPFHKDD